MNSGQAMPEPDLSQLESRIERLIESYKKAQEENLVLKQQQMENARVNAELRRRLANVVARIEALEQG